MKTIVVTYKGVVVKDPHRGIGKRCAPGDVVEVSDDDATVLVGMGRAKPYPMPKEPGKEPSKGNVEKEPAIEMKKEPQSASARTERKKE